MVCSSSTGRHLQRIRVTLLAGMRFFGVQKSLFGIQNLFLTFSEVKGGSPIALLFLTFWKVNKRQGWVFQVGDPKAAAKAGQTTEKAKQCMNEKSSNNNRRSTNNKPHKQQQVAQTAAQIVPNSNNSSTNNIISSKNILEGQKRAMIGFSTVGDLEAPAAAAATKQQQSSKNSKSSSMNNSKPQKRQQKQHEQQEKQYKTRKANIKQQQNWQKQHKKQQKQYKHFGRSKAARVCFSHNNRCNEARMRGGPNPDK